MTLASFPLRTMKIVLITGATGFLGKRLANRLAGGDFIVRVLIRNKNKANDLNLQNIQIFTGDVTQPETLSEAVRGV